MPMATVTPPRELGAESCCDCAANGDQRVMGDAAEVRASPYLPAEIVELVRSHGLGFAPGLEAWLRVWALVGDEIYAAIEPLIVSDQYTREMSEAVRDGAQRLDESERLAIATQEIRRSDTRRPSLELLRDVRLHETDHLRAAAVLIDEYDKSGTNNERRRDLFDVWEVLAPTSPTARQRLFDQILFLALKVGGRQAFDLVKQRPNLWRDPPDGRKRAVKEALREAAGKSKDPALERLLEQHGVVRKRRKGLLGVGSEEIDED